MKTKKEADGIQQFCAELSAVLSRAGTETKLNYNNASEYVVGTVNGTGVNISVYADNIEAASRDVVRGIYRVL